MKNNENKEMNIFEKEQMIKKAEDIKASIIDRAKKVKGMMYRGISLGMALAILASSTAFGGTHTVDNWEDYKKAIVADIMKQDEEIIIHYTGKDYIEYNGDSKPVNDELARLAVAAKNSMNKNAEVRNIHNLRFQGSTKRDMEKDVLYVDSVTHTVSYKTPTEDFQQAVNFANSYLDKHITSDMSDYMKLKIAFDFVIEAYDYGFASGGTTEQNQKDERNLWLGLNGGPVVCEAYANLFSKMVEYMGYENMIVHGRTSPEKEVGHAWNLVKIGDNWYNFDPTNGDGENNFISTYKDWRYDMFLQTDEELDYFPNSEDYPTANKEFNQDIYSPNTKEENEDLADEIKEALENLTNLDSISDIQTSIHTLRYGAIKAEVQAEFDLRVKELEDEGDKEEGLIKEIRELIESLADLDEASHIQSLIDSLEDAEAKVELQDKLNAKVDELESAGDKEEGLIEEIKALIENLTNLGDVSPIQSLINSLEDEGVRLDLQSKLDSRIAELKDDETPETVTGTVYLNYEDLSGNTLKESDTHFNVGSKTFYAPEIEGYKVTTESAITITIEEQDEEVNHTFLYETGEEPGEEPGDKEEGLIKEIEGKIERLTDLDNVAEIQDLIDTVEDTEDRAGLQDKLNAKIDELTEEVEPEEPEEPEIPSEDLLIERIEGLIESLTNLDKVTDIQDLIDTIEDTGAKSELQGKLDAKIDELTEEVELEEPEEPEIPSEDLLIERIEGLIESLTNLDKVTDIQDLIDTVEDTGAKAELQGKLDAKIDELTEEVGPEEPEEPGVEEEGLIEEIKALIENLTDLGRVTEIQDLIDTVEDSGTKAELQDKLDTKVEKLEEIESDESELVEMIESLIGNLTNLDNAIFIQDLIDTVKDSETREGLQDKLDAKVDELKESEGNEEGDKEEEDGEDEDNEGEDGDKEPETPETEPEPETPENPDDNENNGDGNDIENPEVPEDNENGDTEKPEPETPETPEPEPETPEKPEPEAPEVETPEVPSVPEVPEVETPEVPSVPEVPEVETPEIPSVPERPTPERPRPERPTPEREENTVKNEDANKETKKENEDKKENEEETKKEETRKETRKNIEEINNVIETLKAVNLHINLSINVNGKEIKPDVEAYIQKEEKTFVPIRFIAEALGYDVDWKRNEEGNIMVFLEGDKGVVFTVGADYVFVAGDPVKLDKGAFIKDNRTYVTLEMLLDVLDAKVSFENINNEMKLNIE